MQKQKDKDDSSGSVSVKDNKIIWDYRDKNILTLDTNDIAIIGEYTDSNGPYIDDWFITFVTKSGLWYNIPWYADNIDSLTQYLCDHYVSDFNVSYLTNSTTFNSVVRYPLTLKDKKLFKEIRADKYVNPKTLLDKIISYTGFDKVAFLAFDLTDELKEELKNASR